MAQWKTQVKARIARQACPHQRPLAEMSFSCERARWCTLRWCFLAINPTWDTNAVLVKVIRAIS